MEFEMSNLFKNVLLDDLLTNQKNNIKQYQTRIKLVKSKEAL